MSLNNLNPYFGTGNACPIAGLESAKHIRKAISHIIPRDTIVEEILEGLAAPGVTIFCDASIGFDETLEPYEYSFNLAKEHMEAAGFVYPEPTEQTGIGLITIMSILALVGAIQIFLLKKRK